MQLLPSLLSLSIGTLAGPSNAQSGSDTEVDEDDDKTEVDEDNDETEGEESPQKPPRPESPKPVKATKYNTPAFLRPTKNDGPTRGQGKATAKNHTFILQLESHVNKFMENVGDIDMSTVQGELQAVEELKTLYYALGRMIRSNKSYLLGVNKKAIDVTMRDNPQHVKVCRKILDDEDFLQMRMDIQKFVVKHERPGSVLKLNKLWNALINSIPPCNIKPCQRVLACDPAPDAIEQVTQFMNEYDEEKRKAIQQAQAQNP